MKRKQSIGGKDETILSATGIRSSRSQRPESTDVISFLCQKALLLSHQYHELWSRRQNGDSINIMDFKEIL